MKRITFFAFVVLLLVSGLTLADTLTLTDGTTLDGTVVPQGDKYWIKLSAPGIEDDSQVLSHVMLWVKAQAGNSGCSC